MDNKRGIAQRLIGAADLMDEPLPGMPLVEIAGDRRVLVENHRGVVEYGTKIIRIKVRYGQLCICGCGMELAKMTKDQLIISGRVDSVHLVRGKC